jgi:hypothetical protein
LDTSTSSVVVAYCHPGKVSGEFHECMLNLRDYDSAHERLTHPTAGNWRLALRSSANISAARNLMCSTFLDKSDADWLWMVDTDMTFAPDTLARLVEHADPVKAPIVGGLCFGEEDGILFATCYELTGTCEEDMQFLRYHKWPENAMFQVFATGGACLLIHRSALEKVRDYTHADGRVGFSPVFPWFQEREFNGGPMGEDVTFCFRAGVAGLPVYVHTGITLGHVKSRSLTVEGYHAQRAMIAQREYLAEAYKDEEGS